jgi:hypothetical protein
MLQNLGIRSILMRQKPKLSNDCGESFIHFFLLGDMWQLDVKEKYLKYLYDLLLEKISYLKF